MKKQLTGIAAFFLLSFSFLSVLMAQNPADTYLLRFVDNLVQQGKVAPQPLMVMDGVPFAWQDWVKSRFNIPEEEVEHIMVFKKDEEAAIQIYGEIGRQGVLLIQTLRKASEAALEEEGKKEEKMRLPGSGRILYIVDGEIVSEAFLHALEPSLIESITVVRDAEQIRHYSEGAFDGVIIIEMKGLKF